MWTRSDFVRLEQSVRPSLKSFSLFLVFLLLSAFCFISPPWSLTSLLLVPAFFLRRYLSILNTLWFYVGICLAWLLQPIFLIIFYFLLVSPLSLGLRLVRAKTPSRGWQKPRNNQRFDRMF